MKSKINLASWKQPQFSMWSISIESDAGLGGASIQVTMPLDGKNNPRITYGTTSNGLSPLGADVFAERCKEAAAIALEWKVCADNGANWEACGVSYDLTRLAA